MPETKETTYLKDLWSEDEARKQAGNQLALLRYRSNLLGADLRITNFGGGSAVSSMRTPGWRVGITELPTARIRSDPGSRD